MKRILFFQPTLNLNGGIERLTTLLSSELSRDYRTSFLTVYPIETTFKTQGKVFSLNEKNVYSFFKLIKIFKRALSLVVFYKKNDIDITIVSADGCIITALVAKVLLYPSMRIIAIMHQDVKKSGFVYRILLRFLLPVADKVIGVSRGITASLENYVNKNRLHYIPNATDISFNIKEAGKPLEKWSDEWFFRESKVFLSVGRLVYQKAHWRLIEAFAEIVKEDQNARLLIAGDGPLRPFLERRIRELYLEQNVFLIGVRANIFPYLIRAKALILDSFFESFGLVIVEALSVGVPVVVADCEFGPREILNIRKIDSHPIETPYGFLTRVPNEGFNELPGEESMVESLRFFLRDINFFKKESMVKRAHAFDVATVLHEWKDFLEESTNS